MQSKDNLKLLLTAIEEGRLSEVKKILAKDLNVAFQRNRSNETPLYVAKRAYKFSRGDNTQLKEIVQYLEKVTVFDSELFDAVYTGDLAEVTRILNENPDFLYQKNEHEDTYLHIAASRGNNDVMKFLQKKGLNVNTKNKYGSTPLHHACYNAELDVIKTLVELGGDINAKNRIGKFKRNDSGELHYAIILDRNSCFDWYK
ncbi:MAG: ankyrin repeat domain-containing protein [Rickettsiaceae bacterium H1]|nr:ankyrin repeat domain-containing protein [Rickettsiaceae bacterium H1]